MKRREQGRDGLMYRRSLIRVAAVAGLLPGTDSRARGSISAPEYAGFRVASLSAAPHLSPGAVLLWFQDAQLIRLNMSYDDRTILDFSAQAPDEGRVLN